jgi:hypothetical protein
MCRYFSKADTISKPSGTQGKVVLLCNQKENDHARQCQFLADRPQADTLEQGEADWSKATTAAETRLGDPDQAAN